MVPSQPGLPLSTSMRQTVSPTIAVPSGSLSARRGPVAGPAASLVPGASFPVDRDRVMRILSMFSMRPEATKMAASIRRLAVTVLLASKRAEPLPWLKPAAHD